MEFKFPFKNIKRNSNREYFRKVLIVRLPCNPIFPIGPIYLADHIHKCFPKIEQQFVDLAIVPPHPISTSSGWAPNAKTSTFILLMIL